MKKTVVGLALLVALSVLAFTAMGGLPWLDSLGLRGEERLLRSRVERYWEARVEGDLDGMAEFSHPLQRTVAEPGMLVTESYQLQTLTLEGDTATAQLVVHSRLKHPILSSRDRTLELSTNWVRYDGKWYLEPAPVGLDQAIKRYKGEWQAPTEPAIP